MARASTPPGPRMSATALTGAPSRCTRSKPFDPLALRAGRSRSLADARSLARSLLARRLLVEPADSGAPMQLARHVLEGHVARGQTHQGVEQQIGGLGDDALLGAARDLLR